MFILEREMTAQSIPLDGRPYQDLTFDLIDLIPFDLIATKTRPKLTRLSMLYIVLGQRYWIRA